jgi:hypothetical protein
MLCTAVNTDFLGSVCQDMGLSALLWPGPILLTRRPWPYVIHHLHFMNIYRLYIAWYRPILLMYVGCINWYFRNKTLFLWLKRPYFHFTDTGVYYHRLDASTAFLSGQCVYIWVKVEYHKIIWVGMAYREDISIWNQMISPMTYIGKLNEIE